MRTNVLNYLENKMEDSHTSKSENELPCITNELPFVMSHLPDFVIKKAERELGETAENKTRCLQELKEIIKDSSTINGIDFYDDFLRQFLRRSKYDVPKALNQLHNYIAMRKKRPLYFKAMPAENFGKVASRNFATFLPSRCPDGCAVFIVQLGNFDPSHIALDDVYRYLVTMCVQSLRDPVTQVCGYKGIYVFKNASPRILWQFTPKQAWYYYSLCMHCLPGRYKEFHLVDESIVLKTMWMLIKGFLSEKMRKRVHVHSSTTNLVDFFPRSVLPEEYGGDLKNYFMSDWHDKANEQSEDSTLGGQPNFF